MRQDPRRHYSHQQSLKTIVCPGPERLAERNAELSLGSETFFHLSGQPGETSETIDKVHIPQSPGKDIVGVIFQVQREFF